MHLYMPKQLHRSTGTETNGAEYPLDEPPTQERPDGAPDDLLDVLGDEYSRSVLRAIRSKPMSGTEVAEMTSMSEPTAFRRLNELADLGFVETRHRIDAEDGHHYKEYHLLVDSISVTFGGNLDVTVDTDRSVHNRDAESLSTLND